MNNSENKKLKKKIKRPFWVPLIISLVILAIACCLYTYSYVLADFDNERKKVMEDITEEEGILFVINDLESTTDIATRLKEGGFINNVNIFKILSKFEGYDGTYKKGSHYLKNGLEMRDIMKILSSDTVSKRVTFKEHYNIRKIAEELKSAGLCDVDEFLKAVNTLYKDEKFRERYPFLPDLSVLEKRDYALEGYLFPDTYFFDLAATPEEIIVLMLDNFYDRYLPSYEEKAAQLGLSMDEVIILASIVERECDLASERRRVAGVFYNRMERPYDKSLEYLQSCATIQYFLERNHIERGGPKAPVNLTEKEEKTEDPYNTYLNKGLPPGPICNPGMASITSVLNLEVHDYYFFVLDTRPDHKGHLFGKTQKQHSDNINLIRNSS